MQRAPGNADPPTKLEGRQQFATFCFCFLLSVVHSLTHFFCILVVVFDCRCRRRNCTHWLLIKKNVNLCAAFSVCVWCGVCLASRLLQQCFLFFSPNESLTGKRKKRENAVLVTKQTKKPKIRGSSQADTEREREKIQLGANVASNDD